MQSVPGLMTFFALLFYPQDFPMAKRFTLEHCMPLLHLLTDYTRVATAEQLGYLKLSINTKTVLVDAK